MIEFDMFIKSIPDRLDKKIFDTEKDNWTVIPRYYFKQCGNDLILFQMI